jgi:hypothetical protein
VCRLTMLRQVTGAAVAAWGLSGLGWLGLATWSSLGDAGIGPICRASGDALDDVLRPELLLGTTLMMLAMKGPLTAEPMHHLWHRSLARHRLRAIGLFWLTCIALWSLVGVLFALAAANASRIGNVVLLVLTLLIALAWQLSPAKATALRRCHLRPPLAVFGVRALLDPPWFALRLTAWCVASCWAVMVAALAAQNATPGLVPMLIASAIIVWEQLLRTPLRSDGAAWAMGSMWLRRLRRSKDLDWPGAFLHRACPQHSLVPQGQPRAQR